MPARLRSPLSLALALAACGDSGGATAGASTTVTTAAATTSAEGTTGPASSSGASTGEAGTASATGTASADATTGAATTGPADTTSTGPGTTTDATTTSATSDGTTGALSGSTGGPVCGDGLVSPGETCDDGSGVGCDSYHDGGDGVCVPADMCSPGYVLAGADCVAELWTDHVHIFVDNTCTMMVMPPSFTVQPGQKLRLDYHNHSADYPVDVWMQYNGGYTDLQPGATWMEKYEHCFGPAPSEGWAKISTACSEVVLPIHCL